jgi:hypothetical protein
MKLCILSFESDRAWTDYGGTTRSQLILRLNSACPSIGHTEAKRLARAILNGEVSEIPIEKEDRIEYIAQFFESIGAVTKIQN